MRLGCWNGMPQTGGCSVPQTDFFQFWSLGVRHPGAGRSAMWWEPPPGSLWLSFHAVPMWWRGRSSGLSDWGTDLIREAPPS